MFFMKNHIALALFMLICQNSSFSQILNNSSLKINGPGKVGGYGAVASGQVGSAAVRGLHITVGVGALAVMDTTVPIGQPLNLDDHMIMALPRSKPLEAYLGNQCSKRERDFDEIISFSKKVERVLGSTGARVAIIARIGRPVSELPEGMRFTHVAFAVYSEITTVNGEKVMGYVMHNLYQQDAQSNVSYLAQDFPIDFFRRFQL